jgi:hypothetical protein
MFCFAPPSGGRSRGAGSVFPFKKGSRIFKQRAKWVLCYNKNTGSPVRLWRKPHFACPERSRRVKKFFIHLLQKFPGISVFLFFDLASLT